jgi:ribosomal protein S27AE
MEEPVEERACAYCGEIFIAHHRHQQYCPEKFGRTNYCKHQQKARVSEQRLAERAIELSKAGMDVYQQTPLDYNVKSFRQIMGPQKEKVVTDYTLDEVGYDPKHYNEKTQIPNSDAYIVTVGEFDITWIGHDGDRLTFKITRQ